MRRRLQGSRAHKPLILTLALILIGPAATSTARAQGHGPPPEALAPPVEDGPFLRPAPGEASEPVWGVKGGIAVGLWPMSGPRGLLRIYAPYLVQPSPRMINYIAVEPIVGRARGLSELEPSQLDEVPGKAMWAADSPEADPTPLPPWQSARGVLGRDGDARTLTFYVFVEPFDNGARPIIEVQLRDDRPREIAFRTLAHADSAPMRSCVLTATMGNYARLRHLWLDDQVADAKAVWEGEEPATWGFLSHRDWGLDDLRVVEGEVLVAATPDEPDPAAATYAEVVPPWWRYQGRTATQYWKAPARPDLVARVNARRTFWASEAPIPGGTSFENFELMAPFEPGEASRFGVIPEGPEALGFDPAALDPTAHRPEIRER